MFSSFWQIVVFVLSFSTFSSINCNVTIIEWSKKGTVSSMFATQGSRESMEDTSIQSENVAGFGIYAIFDGHGGDYSSIFAKDRLTKMIENELKLSASNTLFSCWKKKLNMEKMLRNFIDRLENYLEAANIYEGHKSGTTCLLVIAQKTKLTVANVGDSRGVFCDKSGKAFNLTIDHKPNNEQERERIELAGGEIYQLRGIWRVQGLAMSRSLGDILLKGDKNIIIATPDVHVYDLKKYKPQFMILASDGLWDVISSQDAVDFIKRRYSRQPDYGAKELVLRAVQLKSNDNITVLIVIFKNGCYKFGSAKA